MEISTARWTVASFLAGVAVEALASLPLVAACGLPLGHVALAAAIVVAVCALGVVVALDLLRARAVRMREPGPRRGTRSGGTARRRAAKAA